MKMKAVRLSVVSQVFIALIVPAIAGPARAAERVQSGRVVAHAVCRVLTVEQVACYFPHIEGISGSLFAETGPPGEQTAFFTARSNTFPSFQPLSNGDVTALLFPELTLNVYYNRSPHGDWNNPDSFSGGELVASFTLDPSLVVDIASLSGSPTAGLNIYSATRTRSKEFVFNGQDVDFKQLVPHGMTFIGMGGPIVPGKPLPFAGSFLAIGGAAAPAPESQDAN